MKKSLILIFLLGLGDGRLPSPPPTRSPPLPTITILSPPPTASSGEDTTTSREDTTTPREDTTTSREDTTTSREDTTTSREDTTNSGEDTSTRRTTGSSSGEDTTTGRTTGLSSGEDTTTTEDIVPEPPLDCTFPDHYCNPTANDLIKKVEDVSVNSAKECQDLCKRQVPRVYVKVYYYLFLVNYPIQ